MRKEYDFSKGIKNPYASRLKKQQNREAGTARLQKKLVEGKVSEIDDSKIDRFPDKRDT